MGLYKTNSNEIVRYKEWPGGFAEWVDGGYFIVEKNVYESKYHVETVISCRFKCELKPEKKRVYSIMVRKKDGFVKKKMIRR